MPATRPRPHPNELIMRASHMPAHDPAVRLIAVMTTFGAMLVASGPATAVLTPERTVVNAAPVTALSVTGRAVAFGVGRTKTSCGTVRLWDTATRGLWTFGSRTILGCEEGFSGGFGIAQVAASGRRVFWVTNVGGNITDYQLWTATPTRPISRRIAHASSETDGPPAIVLGRGTRDGVPYAVERVLTFVSPSGTRLFRTAVGSPVRLLTSGAAVGSGRVLAALADGQVVLFSKTGVALRTDDYGVGEVRAIALGPVGPLVQVGQTVNVGPFAGGTKVTLPAGALMLDYRRGWIVYRKGTQARARQIATGDDVLLTAIALAPYQPLLLSTDTSGSAWARRAAVSWRSGSVS